MVNIAAEIVMYDNSIRWGEAQEMADLVLAHVEEAGMLPPENKVDKTPNGPYRNYSYKNEWQPEDAE